MIQNYFRTALRNFSGHAIFSFINVLGLTVGLTACFLIYIYVSFEISYDRFHTKADRIYRVACDTKTPAGTSSGIVTPAAVGFNMKAALPEVESVVRFYRGGLTVRRGDVKFDEENILFADSSIFSVFDFPLLKGNPRTVLKTDFSMVLSETAAKKYFGLSDPIGKIVLLGGTAIPSTITGIMKDIPENSHIKADMVLSNSFQNYLDTNWTALFYNTYVLLRPGTDEKKLESKLPAFLKRYIPPGQQQSQLSYSLFLEPLRDVYLRSKRGGEVSGSISNVYIFSVIALFILIIASINFINLSTARAAERAKEVGVRKVVGATRVQLIGQFMAEALLIALTAFILATLLSAILLPFFNDLAGKTLSPGIFEHRNNIIILFLTSTGIGIAAGIYPALVLSTYRPALVLKGRFAASGRGVLLRKGLVIAQFTISIILITGTMVIYNQLHFMRNKDLGFRKTQTIIIPDLLTATESAFKQQVMTIPKVLAATYSTTIPGDRPQHWGQGNYLEAENKSGAMQEAQMDLCFVDFDFIKQYQIKMVAGRPFSKNFGTDSTQALILNETAVKMLGYTLPEQAIGKPFLQWGNKGKIIGVARDFHFRSLNESIKPLSMRIMPKYNYQFISINVAPDNLPVTIAAIKQKFMELMPDVPFNYYFLDEYFDRQYRAETRFESLFFDFAILAIFISCLGLFGLVSYSTIQRTREIGIRKVLGASVSGIVNLLSIDFLKLVFISFLIASPVAWLVMNKWLENFAYRINISWWVFAVAAILSLLIAMLTISFQAIKAAIANPVKSLRTE
jgi:putative ABC transport system permease protein